MKKVKIFNPIIKNEIYVSVVRFFQFHGSDYFVYYDSQEPLLENNRMTIYVAKLKDNVSVTILDSEWKEVYSYLRMIGYAKKENKKIDIHDLSCETLNGLIINEFKILSLNYENLKYFVNGDIETSSGIHLKEAKRVPFSVQQQEKAIIDYQTMYQRKLEENEMLKKKIEDLENLTLRYELNLQQIRNALNDQIKNS